MDKQQRLRGDHGASLVEYALLVVFIAAVCLSAIVFFGTQNEGSLNDSSSRVGSAN